MKSALDSSVIVSALCAGDPDHQACRKVLLASRHSVIAHAFAETFSALTGGRLGFRVPASDAAKMLREQIAPKLSSVPLDESEILAAFEEAESRGVRGGAIYDYLHLIAARKAGAKRIYTLNLNDFLSFHRPGDPEILSP
ncbi:MAG: PIN domain-containing protein [Gloeobacteraceae cyanobacterium ES-bin-144]|nr:PIN domain-containing protein [Verrucomicrobiales bacterium]